MTPYECKCNSLRSCRRLLVLSSYLTLLGCSQLGSHYGFILWYVHLPHGLTTSLPNATNTRWPSVHLKGNILSYNVDLCWLYTRALSLYSLAYTEIALYSNKVSAINRLPQIQEISWRFLSDVSLWYKSHLDEIEYWEIFGNLASIAISATGRLPHSKC